MGTWLAETCRDLEWTYDEGRELWVKLVFYNNYTQMYGQQNIKLSSFLETGL